MIIKLPYPPKELMPNKKHGTHWTVTQKAKKASYKDAFNATKEALGSANVVKRDTYPIHLTFVQSDKRYRDLDNLLSASKSMLDGFAQALGVNDKQFDPITITRGYENSNYLRVICEVA